MVLLPVDGRLGDVIIGGCGGRIGLSFDQIDYSSAPTTSLWASAR